MHSGTRLKGISPIISTVMLIVLTVALGTIVTVWTVDVTRNVTNITGDAAMTKVQCQQAGYDFDYSFATKGINYSFATASNYIDLMLTNTGSVNLYNFSAQAWTIDGGQTAVYDLEMNSTTQRTQANPLKPGQTALLKAVVATDINGTLSLVRVNNLACKDEYAEQEF